MIIRRRHRSRFVSLPNAMLEDTRLSLDTKGLLAFLLSRPANWQVRHDHLRASLGIGRHALDRMIGEALATGYMRRDDEQGRDEQNRFATYDYVVDDTPERSADAENRHREGDVPDAENQQRDSAENRVPGAGFPQPETSTGVINTESINKVVVERGVIGSDAHALAVELFPIVDIDPTFPPPGWCGLALQVQAWLDDGATADVIRSAFRKASAGRIAPPNGPAYFSKAIAREKAIATQPLPQLSTNAGSTPRGRRNGTSVLAYLQQKRARPESGQPTEG